MAGKILIVDDEKDMLLLLQRIISGDTRHAVVTEANPLKACFLNSSTAFRGLAFRGQSPEGR